MFTIGRGRVKYSRLTDNADEIILRLLTPGESFRFTTLLPEIDQSQCLVHAQHQILTFLYFQLRVPLKLDGVRHLVLSCRDCTGSAHPHTNPTSFRYCLNRRHRGVASDGNELQQQLALCVRYEGENLFHQRMILSSFLKNI
jgi:hypothetical protein